MKKNDNRVFPKGMLSAMAVHLAHIRFDRQLVHSKWARRASEQQRAREENDLNYVVGKTSYEEYYTGCVLCTILNVIDDNVECSSTKKDDIWTKFPAAISTCRLL